MTGGPVRAAWRPDRLVALTQRVGVRDRAAAADFYDATSPCVYGLALTVLQSPQLAEVATQEVYAEVWRTAADFDPNRGSVLAWLMSLAHRHVAERAHAAGVGSPPERSTGPGDAALGRVGDEGGFRLDAERARRALSTLEDQQRQAVTLAYFGGRSQQEVARILDLPLGTVKICIRDGLVRLREAMGGRP